MMKKLSGVIELFFGVLVTKLYHWRKHFILKICIFCYIQLYFSRKFKVVSVKRKASIMLLYVINLQKVYIVLYLSKAFFIFKALFLFFTLFRIYGQQYSMKNSMPLYNICFHFLLLYYILQNRDCFFFLFILFVCLFFNCLYPQNMAQDSTDSECDLLLLLLKMMMKVMMIKIP